MATLVVGCLAGTYRVTIRLGPVPPDFRLVEGGNAAAGIAGSTTESNLPAGSADQIADQLSGATGFDESQFGGFNVSCVILFQGLFFSVVLAGYA